MSLPSALEALKRKDYAAARELISREDDATFGIQHFLIKGLSELALKDWGAAGETFLAATQHFPDHALFWLNRGVAEENLRQTDQAIASQERCLALAPAQAEACGNLSNLYRTKGRFADAETMARRALALGAATGDSLNCLGLALCKQGRFDEARTVFIQAHEAAPDNAAILANHANLEVEVFNFDEAWRLFAAARALSDAPVMRHDEGLARLLSGDFESGWTLFEARLELPTALRLHPSCPRWHGEDLKDKKLLILAEQGFGDVIQFCRYQAFLPDGDLVWAVPKPLVRLLSGSLRGTVLDETTPLPDCDTYIPIISLAFETIRHPGESRDPAASDSERMTPSACDTNLTCSPNTPPLPVGTHTKKIGLVWSGSPTHQRDYERSIPLPLFAPLFDAIEADFYAPVIGAPVQDICDFPLIHLDHLITDFADTAALLRQMDCLVTVDTATAHLAGALGVKTFLLLPRCPDWRWGIAGDTTPLYPSLTLLRQTAYGDWSNVIAELIVLLKRRL